jgi:hypothetical protein
MHRPTCSDRQYQFDQLATVPVMATCPGALIHDADNTVMACTEDEEPGGCHGREVRHEGDAIRCWTWTLSGCNYCGGYEGTSRTAKAIAAASRKAIPTEAQ